MSEANQSSKSDSLERDMWIDALCDRFESALQAGQKLTIHDFLKAEGIDPANAHPNLLLELRKQEDHYHSQAGTSDQQTAEHFPAVTLVNNPTIPSRIGQVIAGRYELIRELGTGGMGTVYLAKQSKPVHREVALKLIRTGIDSRSIFLRFEAERQAIAMMNHPNIARFYDAGTTEEQEPFFVMEPIPGMPITKYCDANRCTLQQRLELFVQICDAIQHAHMKGIIHRDIKPSNVLVSVSDGRPIPKVIDFGLAKAIDRQLTALKFDTEFGVLIGTLEYMSPEQAELTNYDIDTRTDVYSLGVLLYELLTGTTPVDRQSFGKIAIQEILRIVREVEATRPSDKLSSTDELPSIAANRNLDPAKLVKQCRGELDWILLKSLEKDRSRRYATANDFARDIERYLADEIVEAQPPSRTYRMKKFIRRNRPQVIAASLIVVTLLAGITGTTIGLLEARRKGLLADDRAEKERLAKLVAQESETKEREARIDEEKSRKYADAINQFVINDFLALTSVEGQDRFGGEGLDRNTTLLDLLNRAATKLRSRKDLEPRIEAELCWMIGVNYRGAGEAAKGVPFLERAVELRQQVFGPNHAQTLSAQNSLALAYSEAGNLQQAIPLFEETLRLFKSQFRPDHPSTLTTMSNLANAYKAAGRLDLAVPLHEETVKLLIATLGPDHLFTRFSMSYLANSYRAAGRKYTDLDIPLFEETLKLDKTKLGPDHPSTLLTMKNLAFAYRDTNKLHLALPLFEETLKLQKTKLGTDHPDTLNSMADLATVYREAGKLTLSLSLSEETLKLQKTKLGPDHPDTLTSMNNLGIIYQDADKLALALPLYEETLKLKKTKLGPDHPDTLISMDNLAGAYQNAGKLTLALPLLQETLKLSRAKLGTDHPDTLTSMNNLAKAYRDAGKLALALPLYEETLKLRKTKLGPDHPDTLTSMNNLAFAYRDAGKLALALPLYEETLKLKRTKLGPDHPSTLLTMNNLAKAYQATKKLHLALPLFEETLKLEKTNLGPDHPSTLITMYNLAFAYRDAGKLAMALPLYEQTFKLSKSKLGPNHPNTLIRMHSLAVAYKDAKKLDLALPLFTEALLLMKVRIGVDHPDTLATMKNLAVAYWSVKQLDKSIPLFEELLKLRAAKLGTDHQDTQSARANLGVNYQDAGRVREAIPLLEEAYRASKHQVSLAWIVTPLLEAYKTTGDRDKHANLLKEQLAECRKIVPMDRTQVASLLAQIGLNLLEQQKWTEAETHLRECFVIRTQTQPDLWVTFATKSALGEAMLGQKKYADSEPLLLQGYEGMKVRFDKTPAGDSNRLAMSQRIPEALDRLIDLYTAMNKPDEVKKWQVERAKYPIELGPTPRERK